MKNIILILVSVFSITLCSCAHLDRIYTVSDIKGTWESTTFCYCFLDIRENGKGYFGCAAGVDDVEVYKITDINFLKGKFSMSFQGYDGSDEVEKLEGYLIGNNILFLSEPESKNNEGALNSDDYLIFLRESIIPDLKKSVKEKIKQIQDGNS